MVITAGLWAAFERNLGRIMGFAVMVGIGFSLLTVSVGIVDGLMRTMLGLFLSGLLPFGLSLGVWSLALTTISRENDRNGSSRDLLSFNKVQGAAKSMPVAAASLLIANFTLAGYPLLAGFPPRVALLNILAQNYPLSVLASLLGSIGLIIGGLRTMAVLVMVPNNGVVHENETWGEKILLILGGTLLVIGGILPGLLYAVIAPISEVFLNFGG